MLIAIDARPLVEKKVGFGNLLYNTLTELLVLDKENDYLLLSDREVYFPIENYNNVRVLQYKDSLLYPKSFYYYYKLARFLEEKKIVPDVFWGTQHLLPKGLPKETKKVLTMHDFTHIRFPKATTKYNLFISKLFFAASVKCADIIPCVSNNTKSELRDFFPDCIENKELITIYEGGICHRESADIAIEKVSEKAVEIAQKPYILFVGTIEPRKNISLLIEAAPKLKKICTVVVCGKPGWEKKNIIDKLYCTENLIYMDYVSVEDKNYLMKNCFCQVQPSLYEGFGIPVVESMQNGTIVMVANNSSLKEIVQEPMLQFETHSVDEFCEKLIHLKNNIEDYQKAKEYCEQRGGDFDWSLTAKEYLKIFQEKGM